MALKRSTTDDGGGGREGCEGRRPEGFLLDGYPVLCRRRDPGGIWAGPGGLDAVILVEVPEERWSGALPRGQDDKEAVVRARLDVYREQTTPLIGYYRERGLLRAIDGNRPIEEVTASLLGAFGVRV
jgi:adenylate kinase family enzyme